MKDKWSVERHYSVLNDTSIEKNSAKMYGYGERWRNEWTQKYLVHS